MEAEVAGGPKRRCWSLTASDCKELHLEAYYTEKKDDIKNVRARELPEI